MGATPTPLPITLAVSDIATYKYLLSVSGQCLSTYVAFWFSGRKLTIDPSENMSLRRSFHYPVNHSL